MMHWFRKLFITVSIIISLSIIGLAIYVQNKGFTKSWITAIENKFSTLGYNVSIKKVTLNAFRGILAKDITIFKTKNKKEILVSLDSLYLDINLSKIFQKKLSVNNVDIYEGTLSLPLDYENNKNKEILKFQNISGRVIINDNFIEISNMKAFMGKINLNIKGYIVNIFNHKKNNQINSILNENSFKIENKNNINYLKKKILYINNQIKKITFTNFRSTPKIDIKFHVDSDSKPMSSASIIVDFPKFTIHEKNYTIERLSLNSSYSGKHNLIYLDKFIVKDESGEASINGKINLKNNNFNFNLSSNINLYPFIKIFYSNEYTKRFNFNSPIITASGNINLSKIKDFKKLFPGNITGNFNAKKFIFDDIEFNKTNFGFSFNKKNLYLREVRLDNDHGVSFLNFKYQPSEKNPIAQYTIESKISPNFIKKIIKKYASKKEPRFIKKVNFTNKSLAYIKAKGYGSNLNPYLWKHDAFLDLHNFKINNIYFDKLESKINNKDKTIIFNNVSLRKKDKKILADEIKLTPHNKKIFLNNVTSNLVLLDSIKTFAPKIEKFISKFKFRTPPSVRLSGTVDARPRSIIGNKPRNNNLNINFECSDKAVYKIYKKNLPFEQPRGQVLVIDDKVLLKKFDSNLLDGDINLNYEASNIRLKKNKFKSIINFNNLSITKLSEIYFPNNKSTGNVSGKLDFYGDIKNITSWIGHGNIKIKNGELFEIPIIGFIPSIIKNKLNINLPSNKSDIVRNANVKFQIDNGLITCPNAIITTNLFLIETSGSISLINNNNIKLQSLIKPRNSLSKTILSPLTQILICEGNGTLKNQKWKIKNLDIPSQIIKTPLKILNTLTESTLKQLAPVVNQ